MARLLVVLVLLAGSISAHEGKLFTYTDGKVVVKAGLEVFCRKGNQVEILKITAGDINIRECDEALFRGTVDHHVVLFRVIRKDISGMRFKDRLEILPQENPLLKGIGKKVSYKVFFKGDPAGNIRILLNGRVIGSTRDNGEIRLRIRKGLNEITAFLEREGKEYISVLVFER